MEDWEKRFSELEAEVDAEFKDKNKAAKPAVESEETKKAKQSKSKKKKVETEDSDDDDSLFDDVAKKMATKAIQKSAEKSLAKMGTNKAIIYSVAGLLGAFFVYKNLAFLIFCGLVLGGIYYWLEVRGKDDDDDSPEELEEDT